LAQRGLKSQSGRAKAKTVSTNKKKKNKEKTKYEGETADVRVSTCFTDPQRLVIRNYYSQQYKKAVVQPAWPKRTTVACSRVRPKKWTLGKPLPSDVAYHPVPCTVAVQLGTPPAGHKYVHVASDVWLIAIGTSMIVDAVQDLGRI